MLSPITSSPRRRNFLVYDLEWIPHTLEVRMVGVYDGVRYRWYSSVQSFIEHELTSQNRGKWMYAHAGGLYDVTHVLDAIYSLGNCFQYRCNFSGSSAVMVHVTRGKNAWHFVDSYWLLKSPLAEIGEWIGKRKGNDKIDNMSQEEKEEWFATCSLTELASYNERDCEILWEAIDHFQDVILEMGGELRGTLASTAMGLFRRKYLKNSLPTSAYANDRAMQAYCAARVEDHQRECGNANYYDVNSSFPDAMRHECPGELLLTNRRIPDDTDLYIADVDISVPDVALPPIPARIGKRIFFPRGKWSAWLTGIDVNILLHEGGRILKVREVLKFAPLHDLAPYIYELYNFKKNASSPMEREAGKLLLNCLYGKFAECEEKESIIMNPTRILDGMRMLFPGVFSVIEDKHVAHRHVPLSAHVVAFARRTLFNFMGACSEFYYCDTDGFATPDELETSSEIGDLKLEKVLRYGHFVRPKIYSLEGDLGTNKRTGEPITEMFKAKGFSEVNTWEKFRSLAEGKEIEQVKTLRVRELYKRGITAPTEKLVLKALREDYITKRFFYPDGKSRPWYYDEIRELK